MVPNTVPGTDVGTRVLRQVSSFGTEDVTAEGGPGFGHDVERSKPRQIRCGLALLKGFAAAEPQFCCQSREVAHHQTLVGLCQPFRAT